MQRSGENTDQTKPTTSEKAIRNKCQRTDRGEELAAKQSSGRLRENGIRGKRCIFYTYDKEIKFYFECDGKP